MSAFPTGLASSALPAAVIVGSDLNALGVGRSLSAGGVSSYVVGHQRLAAAMWSRHVNSVHVQANYGPSLLDALKALGDSLAQQAFMVLTDERALATISESREALRDGFRLRLPPRDIVTTLQNKARFHEFATANGFPVPRGLVIRDAADIDGVRELNFPAVIKPADKLLVHGGNARRLSVVSDWRTAEALCRSLVNEIGEIIVQECVGGPESHIYFCLFYCGGDGTPIMFTGRKLGNPMASMDSTVFCTGASRLVSRKLEYRTLRFIERTGYLGFGSVEYKLDPRSRRFVIIEPTVGRTDWQEEIATLSGFNLPLAAYCQEFGLPYQPAPRSERTVWRSSWSDRVRVGKPSLPANAQIVDGYWRADDPRPAMVHYARNLHISLWVILNVAVRRLMRAVGPFQARASGFSTLATQLSRRFASTAGILATSTWRMMRRFGRAAQSPPVRAAARYAGAAMIAVSCVGAAASSYLAGPRPGAGQIATADPSSIGGNAGQDRGTAPARLPTPVSYTPSLYTPSAAPAGQAAAAAVSPGAVGLPSPAAASAAASPRSSESLEVGDKLKIVLYERVENAEHNKWARVGAPALGYEERPEFSGDYTIGADGSLSIPLLGQIRAADLDQRQVEAALSKSFKSLTGIDAVVSILSIVRPGIYVLGPVKNPGAYAFVPGMTVLHAIAIAGGTTSANNASWERVEAVQEYGKRNNAIEDLPTLMARVTVLRAERSQTAPQPPPTLVRLVGEARARQLIDSEAQNRAASEDARRIQERALAGSLQAAKQAVETASHGIGMMDALIKMRAQRAAGIKSLAATGTVTNLFLLQAQGDLTDAEQRRQQAADQYVAAVERVSQISEERARLEAHEKISLDESIADIERRIVAGEREISASNGVLAVLNVGHQDPQVVPTALEASDGGSVYEIVRQSPHGPIVVSANEMTELRPGDLVRIRTASRQLPFEPSSGLDTQASNHRPAHRSVTASDGVVR